MAEYERIAALGPDRLGQVLALRWYAAGDRGFVERGGT
jgi:hypothetical protein